MMIILLTCLSLFQRWMPNILPFQVVPSQLTILLMIGTASVTNAVYAQRCMLQDIVAVTTKITDIFWHNKNNKN